MNKKIVYILILAIFLVGCTSQPQATQATEPGNLPIEQSENENSSPPQTEETVNLQLTIMGGEAQTKLLDKWIPIFEDQNPNIKVRYSVLDWSNGKSQILTSFAGGASPDLVLTYSGDIPQYVAAGALSPLENDINLSEFVTAGIDMATWNDHVYAIPWNLKVHSYYYRTDLFEEAGLDPNTPPETWEDLIEVSTQLTKRDGVGNLEQVGLWIITSHPYKTLAQYSDFLWSAGGRFFSEDGCKSEINSPESIAAVELLRDLLNEYKVDDPGSIQVENVDFAQGKVAALNSNNAARGMMENSPEIIPYVGIVSTPVREEGMMSYSQAGGNYLGISNVTKNRDEAMKLLLFLTTTPELVQEYSTAEFGPPALKSASTQEYLDSIPFMERWVTLLEENGKGLPQHPNWGQINDIINVALDQVYLTQRDPQEALDEAAGKIDSVLNENGCAVGW